MAFILSDFPSARGTNSLSLSAACKPHVLVIGARGIPDVEGGAEKNAEAVFPRVVREGYEVTLVALGKNVKAPSFRGVRLVSAPCFWAFRTEKLAYYIVAFWHALRIRPDIVHLQGLGASLFLLVYRALGFKTVARYGSADYVVGKWSWIGRAGFRAAELQLRFADAVIAVTETLSDRLARRGVVDNVHVIPNALDDVEADRGSTHKRATPYVLVVGRVTAQKNLLNVVDGFERLSRSDLELVLAGGLDDKLYVNAVTARIHALKSDRVRLMGRQSRQQLHGLFSNCALYANLSLHEGNSNATLEAISYGCPLLLSDIPENRDLGLAPHHYVDPHDPEAIAEAFAAALKQPEAYKVDRAGFLQWNDVAQQTVAIYRRLGSEAKISVRSPTRTRSPANIGHE